MEGNKKPLIFAKELKEISKKMTTIDFGETIISSQKKIKNNSCIK